MRVLVTGGAGFIGSHLVEGLLARGDSVIVLDDLSTGRRESLEGLPGKLELVVGDVADGDLVARCVSGVDAILHQAAMPSVAHSVDDPVRCDAVNVHATVRLLEAARSARVRRLVLAASAAAYGDDPELPKREDMRPCPLSPYAVSKVAAEHYVRVFAELYGMQTVSLRYFNVFGPRQSPTSDYAAVIPRFVDALLAGRRPRIFGDGEQTRDFCYVGNVVDANLRALAWSGARGQVINVAHGESMTINALAALLARIVGTDLEPAHEAPRAGDVRHSRADVSRARDLLGWEAGVGVEDGLRRTIAALRPPPPS